MDLKTQKRLAGQILKCSPKRVKFEPAKLNDIKESITKEDLRVLIDDKTITKNPVKGVSRVRARARAVQRKKGLQKGPGSKKAKQTANVTKKDSWIKKIRIQRSFIKELKDKGFIEQKTYTNLYKKSKGGFFRSKRHIKLYVDEHDLSLKEDKVKK